MIDIPTDEPNDGTTDGLITMLGEKVDTNHYLVFPKLCTLSDNLNLHDTENKAVLNTISDKIDTNDNNIEL